MSKTATSPRSENINIRATPDMIGLIDRAARVFGKTRTDFILDTMRKAAEDALLDQRSFLLDPKEWDAFNAALDAPPRANPRLCALLAREPAWEK